MKFILIVGACGSGKTWIMKQLVKDLKLNTLGKVGMFYFHRNEKVIVLGKYDGSTFEGSDKLSMAVMRDLPAFQKYVKGTEKERGHQVVVCEGDRFTNSTFIDGVKPIIIKIMDDGKKGRKKRKSNQTERQIKSIQTRIDKITNAKYVVLDSKVAYDTIKDVIKE